MNASNNIKYAIPFFMVSNMEISLPFYTEKLGFSLVNQWTPEGKIEWCCLQRDVVFLMLQEPRIKETNLLLQKGKGVSICFQCEDALALYQEFLEKNLKMKEPFVGNQMWVVGLQDPDGYCLDFESPTEVPEETTYSNWKKDNKG